MTKTILLLFSFISFVRVGYAQNDDKILAIATYTYSHLMDTTKANAYYTESMQLQLSQSASVFSSADLTQAMHDFLNYVQKPTTSRQVLLEMNRYYDPTELFVFQRSQKTVTFEKLIQTFYFEKHLEQINWTIRDSVKIFNNLTVQEATVFYKGREWTAWFCADIAFQAGPWELYGLPGLIVHAYDKQNHISFSMDTFYDLKNKSSNEDKNTNTRIDLNDKIIKSSAIKTTFEGINRLRTAYIKNPHEFVSSQRKGPGSMQDVFLLESIHFKPQCNNPIALNDLD